MCHTWRLNQAYLIQLQTLPWQKEAKSYIYLNCLLLCNGCLFFCRTGSQKWLLVSHYYLRHNNWLWRLHLTSCTWVQRHPDIQKVIHSSKSVFYFISLWDDSTFGKKRLFTCFEHLFSMNPLMAIALAKHSALLKYKGSNFTTRIWPITLCASSTVCAFNGMRY